MQGVKMRGIRGAIDVSSNHRQEIIESTKELLKEIFDQNTLENEDVAAILFSMTDDLDAAFPAEAVRQMGGKYIPVFCTREINVPGSLPRCIRLLVLANTSKAPEEIRHIYLRGAAALREDLHGEASRGTRRMF